MAYGTAYYALVVETFVLGLASFGTGLGLAIAAMANGAGVAATVALVANIVGLGLTLALPVLVGSLRVSS